MGMLADWMPNRDFLVDWPERRDKAVKPGLSRLKRDVWYAYYQGRVKVLWGPWLKPRKGPFYIYVQSSKWRSSKWCTHCKHRCAAVLAHIQGCHIKKRNGKQEMHQKGSLIKQVQIGQFWNLSLIINQTSIYVFHAFFVIFLWSHDLEKVMSLSVWLGVHRTPKSIDPCHWKM